MFGGIRKIPTTCPHCGFVQSEPASLISTYCRGCGDHYTVTREVPSIPAPAVARRAVVRVPSPRESEPGAIQRLLPEAARRWLSPSGPAAAPLFGGPTRLICDECGLDHPVNPGSAKSVCPTCGAEADLSNVEIAGHYTRSIDTRGVVTVARTGFLNSMHTRCGGGRISGRFSGLVECSGTLRIFGTGVNQAQIHARTLVVDRGSDFRFVYPLAAGDFLIRGRVEADIVCPGTVRVGRYGEIEGKLRARSLIVDKGGGCRGDVEVTAGISAADEPRPRPERENIHVLPAWRSLFA